MKMIHQITKYITLDGLNYLNRGTNLRLQFQTRESINKVLTAFFKTHFILISKPVYTVQEDTIKISLCYYKPEGKQTQSTAKWNRKLKRREITKSLEQLYIPKFFANLNTLRDTKPIIKINKFNQKLTAARLRFLVLLISRMLRANVQLDITRLKYVYHDTTILAQFLGINSHRTTYGQLKKILQRRVSINDKTNNNDTMNRYSYKLLPNTYLTGFKIRISGRLHRQRIVPKKTVKSTYKGYISPRKMNIVDTASYTGKNKKGAFTIRVWLSHGTREKFVAKPLLAN